MRSLSKGERAREQMAINAFKILQVQRIRPILFKPHVTVVLIDGQACLVEFAER